MHIHTYIGLSTYQLAHRVAMLIGTNKLCYIMVLFPLFWDRIPAINVLLHPPFSPGSSTHFSNINLAPNTTFQCDIPCVWTVEPSDLDAEFYLLTNNIDALWSFRDKQHAAIRIAGSTEGQHSHSFISNEYIHKYIGASALLETGTEIPWRVNYGNYPEIHKMNRNKYALRIAVSTSSDCGSTNNGNQAIMEIDQIMPVARIGSCLNNEPWPKCSGAPCSPVEAIQRYAFCLAFENGDTPGFVSDKIFDCHRAGSIPVYLGTSEVVAMVPRGSFIFVRDFRTTFDLAKYLVVVATNATLYESYFAWKRKPLNPEFVEQNRAFWEFSFQCRVCRYVSVAQQGQTWDITTQNWTNESRPSNTELKQGRVPQISSKNQRLKPRSYIDIQQPDHGKPIWEYSLLLGGLFIVAIGIRSAKRIRIFSRLRLLWIK